MCALDPWRRLRLLAVVVAAIAVSLVSPTSAALTQPDGATIPAPLSCSSGMPSGLLSIFACQCTQPGACNIGAPCSSVATCDDGQRSTCESTIWHAFNDNTCIPTNHSGLDPVADATLAAQTFRPKCALTFTVVSRGNALFQNVFGWYNAVGSAPAAADLHPILGCTSGAGASVTLDLSKEPAWRGGDIAFFLMTPEARGAPGRCSAAGCCPSVQAVQAGQGYVYTTERAYDPDQQNGAPFVHLLAYASRMRPQSFYFACEDTYGGGDDDFADLVTRVDGVDCPGAGQQCSTGKLGVCAFGVTACDRGQVTCRQVEDPGPEICDGVDNDCDGQIDEGATCPEAGDVCDNGRCVPHCGPQEFPCSGASACNSRSGLCVDPSCLDVACPAGEVCRGGRCGTPCTDVVCPHGTTCVADACVDLCAAVSCPAGQVCQDGVCLSACGQCGGVECAPPLACDAASGRCGDPSCSGGCPGGTFCREGRCLDDCTGARCPDGQACLGGACVPPGAAVSDGGFVFGGPGGADGGAGGPEGGANGGAFGVGRRAAGCSCEAAGLPSLEGYTAAAFCAIAWGRRLRRRRRSSPSSS